MLRNLFCCLAIAVLLLARNLGAQQTQNSEAAENVTGDSSPRLQLSRILDISGYLSFRSLTDDDGYDQRHYREYAGSVFLSKSAGPWKVHSEFNLNNAPASDSDGVRLLRHSEHAVIDLDTAWVSYSARDWLQIQSGFVFVPTWWRTHRYQSTTLTPDDPLIDQAIFPPAIIGGLVQGDKYWEGGGISYVVYGGRTQENDPDAATEAVVRARALGGKLVWHVPAGQSFQTLDIGVHHLRERDDTGLREDATGLELLADKGRFSFRGEYAYGRARFPGRQGYFRRGYYAQPSWAIRPRLHLVVRLDSLEQDSRFHRVITRDSAGLTWRPVPALSAKVSLDRHQPDTRGPAHYGFSAGLVYFFRLL